MNRTHHTLEELKQVTIEAATQVETHWNGVNWESLRYNPSTMTVDCIASDYTKRQAERAAIRIVVSELLVSM